MTEYLPLLFILFLGSIIAIGAILVGKILGYQSKNTKNVSFFTEKYQKNGFYLKMVLHYWVKCTMITLRKRLSSCQVVQRESRYGIDEGYFRCLRRQRSYC